MLLLLLLRRRSWCFCLHRELRADSLHFIRLSTTKSGYIYNKKIYNLPHKRATNVCKNRNRSLWKAAVKLATPKEIHTTNWREKSRGDGAKWTKQQPTTHSKNCCKCYPCNGFTAALWTATIWIKWVNAQSTMYMYTMNAHHHQFATSGFMIESALLLHRAEFRVSVRRFITETVSVDFRASFKCISILCSFIGHWI